VDVVPERPKLRTEVIENFASLEEEEESRAVESIDFSQKHNYS
jgi:hypothetical protein